VLLGTAGIGQQVKHSISPLNMLRGTGSTLITSSKTCTLFMSQVGFLKAVPAGQPVCADCVCPSGCSQGSSTRIQDGHAVPSSTHPQGG
jgi:hypothetical protein